MRGPLHHRLVALLNEQLASGDFTQESLAHSVQMHQTTIGGILKKNAGTLDLDEAYAALAHIGSSLSDFLSHLPPRALTDVDRAARLLAQHPDLLALIEALAPVSRTRRAHVLDLVRQLAPLATRKRAARTDAASDAPPAATRTTRERAKRR